jgi:hypothetical protein
VSASESVKHPARDALTGCSPCGKPVEPGRRKYCSDACADSSLRAAIKLRKLSGTMRPKLLYRLTSYRDT